MKTSSDIAYDIYWDWQRLYNMVGWSTPVMKIRYWLKARYAYKQYVRQVEWDLFKH